MARDNFSLGQFEIDFEPAPRYQARVGVQFELDANGLLKVLARDTKTGREHVVELRSAVDVTDERAEKMIADSVEHAFDDFHERRMVEARLKANELRPAVRHALDAVGNEISADDRATIERRLAELEAALAGESLPALQEATIALDDATQLLATILMERAME